MELSIKPFIEHKKIIHLVLIILRFCQKRIGNCNLFESTGIFFPASLSL